MLPSFRSRLFLLTLFFHLLQSHISILLAWSQASSAGHSMTYLSKLRRDYANLWGSQMRKDNLWNHLQSKHSCKCWLTAWSYWRKDLWWDIFCCHRWPNVQEYEGNQCHSGHMSWWLKHRHFMDRNWESDRSLRWFYCGNTVEVRSWDPWSEQWKEGWNRWEWMKICIALDEWGMRTWCL